MTQISLLTSIPQRVHINTAINQATDHCALARWANHTQPHTSRDWRELIVNRALDLGPDPSWDELVGLAADVHGWLEHHAREDAA